MASKFEQRNFIIFKLLFGNRRYFCL